jgi:hypothetical protein
MLIKGEFSALYIILAPLPDFLCDLYFIMFMRKFTCRYCTFLTFWFLFSSLAKNYDHGNCYDDYYTTNNAR